MVCCSLNTNDIKSTSVTLDIQFSLTGLGDTGYVVGVITGSDNKVCLPWTCLCSHSIKVETPIHTEGSVHTLGYSHKIPGEE